MSGSFGALDWGVVGALLLITTWIGHRAAGRQESLRDFFLGGRRLPWYAVAASIVATEISAVTFISLPSVVAREGGDWTYLQIGLFGSLFARGLIAWLLVPAYYEREVFSPYDYMGAKLGEGVRRTATALFALGGIRDNFMEGKTVMPDEEYLQSWWHDTKLGDSENQSPRMTVICNGWGTFIGTIALIKIAVALTGGKTTLAKTLGALFAFYWLILYTLHAILSTPHVILDALQARSSPSTG